MLQVIAVSSDSVSMLSEACATAKPVLTLSVHSSRRLSRLHAALLEISAVEPFSADALDHALLCTEPAAAAQLFSLADMRAAVRRVGSLLER